LPNAANVGSNPSKILTCIPLDLLDVASFDRFGRNTLNEKLLDIGLGDLGIAQRDAVLGGFRRGVWGLRRSSMGSGMSY
jgi:hypothetical protein